MKTAEKIGAYALLTLLMLSATSSLYAFKFDKPVTATVEVTPAPTNNRLRAAPAPLQKRVTLMGLQLTPTEKEALLSQIPQARSRISMGIPGQLPRSVSLGMNGVPVLNQGMHGSCVTFAVTGALDALLKKGDYISQLCNLELGNHLENQGYMPSGWDGTFSPIILGQILRFGIVNKAVQKNQTCAGVTEYPMMNMDNTGNPMLLDEFKGKSEALLDVFYPQYHLNIMQRFDRQWVAGQRMPGVLHLVKQSLADGHRLVLGTVIPLAPSCNAGACATHLANQDTWALTSETRNPSSTLAGHELIITGYDDNAMAVDSQHQYHRGLLILRNSWGGEAGNQGDFYMSYDYFQAFALDVAAIVPAPEDAMLLGE